MGYGSSSVEDGDDDFEAIFDMMMNHCSEPSASSTSRPRDDGVPAAKRPRTLGSWDAGPQAAGAAAPAAAAGEPEAAASSSSAVVLAVKESEAPPERVALAFALLELPLIASGADIERQGRRLARKAHPDKVAPEFPELREAAERRFRELQDAKATALAWLQGRLDADDCGGWPNSSNEEDEASSDVDSRDDEARMELKACGIGPTEGDWEERRDSPRERDRDLFSSPEPVPEGVDGQRAPGPSGLRISDTSGGQITTSDSVLDQVTALSGHLSSAWATGRRMCGECLERPLALEDKDVCKHCWREMDKLWRSLGQARR